MIRHFKLSTRSCLKCGGGGEVYSLSVCRVLTIPNMTGRGEGVKFPRSYADTYCYRSYIHFDSRVKIQNDT